MSTSVKLLIFIGLFPLLVNAQQRWYSTFGWPGERENSVCIKESYDKGYIISGNFFNAEGIFVKANTNGDELWKKVFISGNSIVKFYAHSETSTGRKILVGHAGSDPIILCLNVCGEVDWCYTFNNAEHYEGGSITDLVVYEDGQVIAMVGLNNLDWDNLVYLFNFDADGNLIWMKRYAKTEDNPDLGFLLPFTMDTIGSDYFITGYCYYRRKDNPDIFTLRPMFIKINENFQEEWLLPYGHNIGLVGTGKGVIKENDTTYRGFGRYNSGNGYNGVMMSFNNEGLETNYTGIPNHLLNDSISDNYMIDFERMNDSLFMVSAIYAFDHGDVIEMGEYIVSSTGNIYESQFHLNTVPAYYSMIKTNNSQFVFTGEIEQDDEWDIFLYKLNNDLSSAEPVTDTITYDYLCNDLPIVSDTIDLSQCGIITGTGEIPTPEEYYANLSTIQVIIQPNPARDRVMVQFGNTGDIGGQLHLKCYNTAGWLMFEQDVYSGNDSIELKIQNWQSGIYVVVVTSDDGKQGSAKFVVE